MRDKTGESRTSLCYYPIRPHCRTANHPLSQHGDSPPSKPAERHLLGVLALLAGATFLITSSGPSLAPFLQTVARDVGTSFVAVAHLFSLQAVMWGTFALIAGTFSDRFGRRSILIAALIGMGVGRIGFAFAPNYAALVAWQLVSGAFGGAFMGAVFAAAADRVPLEMRSRALGWIVTGQSLSILLGAPIVTVMAALGGWRGAIGAHGVSMIAAGIALSRLIGADAAHTGVKRRRLPLSHLLQAHWLTLLAAGTTERMCFALVAIYLPTFLQQHYAISLSVLGAALALVAAGTLLGSFAGAKLADRFNARMRLFAAASLATACLAVPLVAWHPALSVSVLLGFSYSFCNALGRPAFLAALSQVPNELRGAVFGLNVTLASVGWLTAASVGAWLITSFNFTVLGLSAAGIALLGVWLARASERAPAILH
jgi:MFS transporter, DHA1 family, inner membrane transport protein